MKKSRILPITLILMAVLSLPAAGHAAEGPMTNKYTVTISPVGQDGKLVAVWQGVPDAIGGIVLPLGRSKMSLSHVSVKGAVLANSQPENLTVDENKGLRFKVRDVSSTGVELTATFTVPKMYARPVEGENRGDSPTGRGARGHRIPFRYDFMNTSLPGIKELQLKVAIPAGYEPFAIAATAKTDLSQKNGIRWVTAKIKGKNGASAVPLGGKVGMTFDYVPAGSKGVTATWVIIGALSVFLLYYRRSMVHSKASE